MRRLWRALTRTIGAVVIVVVLAFTVFANTPFGTTVQGLFSQVTGGAGNAAANAALDASGIKGRVESALRENVGAIASATGLSESQVSAAIDALDVESWSVASLPSGVVTTGSTSGTYDGVDATVTTYSDPAYVTVSALGQTVTLSVPTSAQPYAKYLQYLP